MADPWPPSGSALPPALPSGTVARPRLEALLAEGVSRRLVTVVADAGFGKSTLLAGWAGPQPCAWYTVTHADQGLATVVAGLLNALRLRVPNISPALAGPLHGARGPDADADEGEQALSYAALLCDALDRHLARDLVLVIDDFQEIGPGGPAGRLVEGLIREAPPRLHLVISSRVPLPFRMQRLRGRGQLLEITGAAMAFTVNEAADALAAVLGEPARALAEPLFAAVQGWPAAVRLATEALRPVPVDARLAMLERVLRPGGPVYEYLAEEIFAHEPPDVRELVRTVAVLPDFSASLCTAIGIEDAQAHLEALDARGLFLSRGGAGERYQLHPLVREFALARMPLSTGAAAGVYRRAADWFARKDDDRAALSCLLAMEDADGVARLLRARGRGLIGSGGAVTVLEAAAGLPAAFRDPALDQIEGEARQVRGDWDGALACFQRAAGDEGEIPPGIAWRMGLIHHLRGDIDGALATYRRGRLDDPATAEAALLEAWWATAYWLRGDIDECRRLATSALDRARHAADDRALAAAHTALAMVAAVDGDRRANDAHYLRALGHAERAGDLLQMIRIRVNRSSRFVEEAYYAEGIAEADEAIRLADLRGFATLRALALRNRGEALLRLGRLDEAIAELEAARALYQRLESRMVSYALGCLAEVYRERGDHALARAYYEEAIEVSQEARDMQGLVPSLAGLARLLIEEEPDRAGEMAERAVSHGPTLGHAAALLALGWVALHRRDRQGAADAAARVAALCRSRRDRTGLAEALELQAAADGSQEPLDEALDIWRDIGCPLGEARVELALAGQYGDARAKELASRARRKFVEAGASRYAAAAAALLADGEAAPAVSLRCLGGFRVLRDGTPVPLAEWRSRKARELLKILISRRGGPVPREQLMELLWPGEDEAKASARLSVALSTVRAILDPGKRFKSDAFVGADHGSAWLVTSMASLDVEEFLRDAERGLQAYAGRDPEAVALLRAAESSYAGDFLEENTYDDWATGLREEGRAAYIRVARTLAGQLSANGEPEAAAGYLLRILQRDPYDEGAHLALVLALSAGRAHGEARRAYRTYVGRMEVLGVEPAPFPSLV